MKKLRLIIPLLLICLSLTGCSFFFPFFFLNFAESAEEALVQELPVGAEVDPKLSAEDIYWRSRFAASERALQYSENATIRLSFTGDSWESWFDMHYDTNVVLDPDSCAVNVQTLLSFDDEEPDVYWDYYRNEDGRLVCYYHEVESGYCSREEIELENSTPYAIILDFTVYGYPYDPQNLSVEPQTRILDGREVYVLTYEQSALYTFGSTGNSIRDDKLSARMIPATWYVDVQTNLPVRQEFTLTQVDDLLGEIISATYQISEAQTGAAITGYTLTMEYTSFDPVDISPIPDEVLKKAWDNAGFSAS